MIHNTKNTYRALNGLKCVFFNISKTHNNKPTMVHKTIHRLCSTVKTPPTFTRGITQVAKQEKISPDTCLTGKKTFLIFL